MRMASSTPASMPSASGWFWMVSTSASRSAARSCAAAGEASSAARASVAARIRGGRIMGRPPSCGRPGGRPRLSGERAPAHGRSAVTRPRSAQSGPGGTSHGRNAPPPRDAEGSWRSWVARPPPPVHAQPIAPAPKEEELMEALERRAVAAIGEAAEPLPSIEEEGFARFIDRHADARVICLGESTHGTSEFYRARAAITERLVSEHGFTAVAVGGRLARRGAHRRPYPRPSGAAAADLALPPLPGLDVAQPARPCAGGPAARDQRGAGRTGPKSASTGSTSTRCPPRWTP